jgi:Mrp family chromosome partitioning ATPase
MGPAELLSGEVFANVIKGLAQQYDHVIIDSPPVRCVADARILAALCDLTVLVLRAGKSTRHLTEQSRDGLLSVGANLIGVVVNDVPNSNSRYGYYSGYGYYRHKDGTIPTNSAGNDDGHIVYADTVKAGENRIEQVAGEPVRENVKF